MTTRGGARNLPTMAGNKPGGGGVETEFDSWINDSLRFAPEQAVIPLGRDTAPHVEDQKIPVEG